MKWERKILHDVADLALGKMLDEKKNKGEFRFYLANVNVRWGAFDLQHLRQMRFQPHEVDRYGLKPGDIVMCEGGEPGRCAIWKGDLPGVMIQKALHRIRSHACLDHRFLFYSLVHQGRSGGLHRLFTGATIKHLPREQLAKVEVQIPPLPMQASIASILVAYDDLIEINRRRIALLEEMARRLFLEWFVHERIPGGDSKDFTPVLLGEVAEIQLGDTNTTKASYVSQGYMTYSASGPDGFLDHFDHEGLGIVLSAIGAQCGKIWLADGRWSCIKNTIFLKARDKKTTTRILYLLLSREDVWPKRGAAQPFISQGDARKVPLRLPSFAVQEKFDQLVAPMLHQRRTLEAANKLLAQSRDLLLPRLISGELSASTTEGKLEAVA